MSKTNFLCLVLAVILLIGIVSLPYDFDLSIGNNSNSGNVSDNNDTDNNSNNDNVDNNPGVGDDNGNNNGSIVTLCHPDSVICESCGKEYLITEKIQYAEDYGSIGILYSLDTCDCGNYLNLSTVLHEYSNKDGICTASGCMHNCTHTFSFDALNYYIPYNDYYSGFDIESPDDYGDVSAVFDGVCAICQKTIN